MGKNKDLFFVDTILFKDLSLSSDILKAIADMGYQQASPIQARAIPLIVQGQDVVGLAMTGTGKTAAFSLPLIDKIDAQQRHAQMLVLCPTRELAIQVANEISKFLRYKKSISVLAVYGGQSIETQLRMLKRGVQIIVGTPGRLIDHIERRSINLNAITSVVLDEADEMLDMGFRPDIERILQKTPANRQTVMFSATMPNDIIDLVKKYQKNPQTVQVSQKNSAASTVEQHYYEIRSSERFSLLSFLMKKHNPYLAIIFCNTKHKVDDVMHRLIRSGYRAEALHSDIRQAKRNKIMNRFRSGDLQVLVATDVAARGIDIPNIDIIFNFELPKDEKSYVHRIGRTGRAGKNGLAISFVSERDGFAFRNIRRVIQANLTRQTVPTTLPQSPEVQQRPFVEDVISEPVSRENGLAHAVQRVLQKQVLSEQIKVVESWITHENTPTKIAAALAYLLSERPSSSGRRPQRSYQRNAAAFSTKH